jgi:3' terminal RNA ribose 2'-O-methyltransferase Hen1
VLLSITTTHEPATDLGYLLHKNPARAQQVDLSFGVAHVLYPQADENLCTCTLMVDVDPVALVRDARSVTQYVTDRPYAASSMLAVAMGRTFSTALAGRCKDRPELAQQPLPLSAHVPVMSVRGGEQMIRRMFEPLGYTVESRQLPLPDVPGGMSRFFDVRLSATLTVQSLLAHLIVLIPVLDDDKHHFVGDDEVQKLLRRGEGWLATHPEKELISQRFLRRRRLSGAALQQLNVVDAERQLETDERADSAEQKIEQPISLNRQRLEAVVSAVRKSGARRVLDLGCGEGNLLAALRADSQFTEIVGVDVSPGALTVARRRLRLDRGADSRISVVHGSVVYPDPRLSGYDAVCLVEVIEHIDPHRLGALEAAVFGYARPQTVVITTPNADYNTVWESLPAGQFRHRDHRFEWTRAQLRAWARQVADDHGYSVTVSGIGPDDTEQGRGQPTQIAVFTREDRS